MKLHVSYNTLCTIELVMHIQMSWMKSRERLPVTTADSDGWAQRCTGGGWVGGGKGDGCVALHRTVQVRLAYSKAGSRGWFELFGKGEVGGAYHDMTSNDIF